MSATNITPVYTELDEQRFKLWLTRLEDSYKTYLNAEDSGDITLTETIKTTIKNDIESYPQWITHHRNIPMGRIASSCDEMKTYLRHVALPHVIAGYRKIIDEICPAVGVRIEAESKEVATGDVGASVEVTATTATVAASSTESTAMQTSADTTATTTDITPTDTKPTPDAKPESETVAPVALSKEGTPSTIQPAPKTVQSTLVVPIHTAPISKLDNTNDTTVEDFFRGLAAGKGDSMVNLCKLADISHRINRAEEHDSNQVAHWIESETARRDENQSILAQRQEKLEYLRGEDEGQLLEQSVGKLKSEVTVLTASLMQAEREEEEARKAYEAAVLKRKTATQTVVNLHSYIDNVATQRDLLKKVNDLRMEADKYNIASAQKRMTVYSDLSRYVQNVRQSFVQRRLAEEMPAMFDNLVAVFNLAQSAAAGRNGHVSSSTVTAAAICDATAVVDGVTDNKKTTDETAVPTTATTAEQDKLSLYCAARVGLETIRIWRQLNLHIAQPALVRSIDEFQAQLTATLATQAPPSPQDPEASGVYQAENSTVVLFFDHLQHDTPEDHVEAQSRVLTCLKMLTDHLVQDPPHSRMEVENSEDPSEGAVKAPRSMKLLNCNDILSPPVWCLPLAHSPQYLAQLWRLAEEAHSADLLVPLEFDTEWISEDPYRSSNSDDEEVSQRIRAAPVTGGTLLKSVDLEQPWQHALDQDQINAFTQLLTPAPSDHMVAKVIKRMEAKATQKANRSQKQAAAAATRSSRAEERSERNERLLSERPVRHSLAAATEDHTSLSSTEGLLVNTPMGSGTVVRNYRSDGIVSVNLKWGAVGHFRADCVQTALGSGGMGQIKVERPIYSAAQAFYVSGSAGRFVHNDMQLHNTMCRLITLAKVQRIIGDYVQINHANLSLYIHGRTSSGLTKTIEATITRWLEKFDQQKLADMLDEAEKLFNAGTPVSQQTLIRMLEQTAMPPGQVSWVRCDRTLGGIDTDGATGDSSALPNPDTASSIATKSKPIKINETDSFIPGRGSTSFGSPTKAHKETRTKVPVDVRTLPKYTKDGETLRELMLSIMRTLKLSQGSLANVYYRNYRFETSQGGVSAWFHFRGQGTVFEGMNHCALMWTDDNKKYLSPQEQALLLDASSRMGQHAGVHSSHAPHSRVPTTTTTPIAALEATNLVQVQSELAAGTAAPVVEGQAIEVSPSTSASPQTHRTESKPAVAPAPVADESSRDDRGLDGDVEDAGSLASESGDDDFIGSSSTMDVDEQQGSTSQGELPTKRIVSGLCMVEQSQEDSSSSSSMVDTRAATEHAGGAVVKEEEPSVPVTPTEYSPTAITTTATTSTAAASSVPADMSKEEIRTIEELHTAVLYEMNRRKVSQSRAAVEARLRDLGMGQPALSKFLSIASINNNDRGKAFSNGMIKWVNFSRTQPAAEGWDPSHVLTFKAPSSSYAKSAVPPPSLSSVYTGARTSASVVEGSDNYDDESDTEGGSMSTPRVEVKPVYSRNSSSGRIGAHVQRIAGPDGRFPDNEELLTCGVCGKPSSEFTNNKSFRMHLAWCYRRKNQTLPPPDHMLRGAGMAEAAAWEPSEGRKRKSGNSATTGGFGGQSDFAKRPRLGTDESMVTDANIVAVDSVRRGFHHDTCEFCKEHGELQRCASCPCVYHARCSDLQIDPDSAWYCPKCTESGASSGAILSEEDKSSPDMADRWILVYSDGLRRWRKAVVLATHSERSGVVLAKWWRSDNKGGKTNWLDLKRGDILSTTPEKIAPTRSRSSAAAYPPLSTAQPSGFRDRSQVVRFDPASSYKKTASETNNARFKTGQSMMHMDGEHGGSVPPLVRAAAEGIGGVAALQDGDYPDNKSSGSAISGNGMSDTYISSNSLKAALCAAGSACRAVDIAMCNDNTNVFACTRPPGHHAGRYGCTSGCLSTGFCMLNNAAMAAIYARVRWGLERVAVVDIDVHFGNGTAELLRNDPNAFFASVHMIYGEDNDGLKSESNKRIKSEPSSTLHNNNNEAEETEGKVKKTRASESLGFYPARMGLTEVTDTYVSVGVYPTLESAPPRSGEARRRKKVVLTYDWDSSSEEGGEGEGEMLEDDEEDNGAADTLSAMEMEGDAKETSNPGSPLSSKRLEKKNSSANMGADTTTTATAAAMKRRLVGSEGFLKALQEVIIPQMEKFRPQLLVISAGFDGYVSDPLGGQLCLSLEDYKAATKMLMHSMDRIKATEPNPTLLTGKVISLLEGGYDTSPYTLGLAKCVDAHVEALQEG